MKETLSKSRDMTALQKIGTYHLGCLYNLEDFLLMDSLDVFPVNELMPNNKTIPRYLVLSQSNLLNFEIIDKKNNQMKLISWANLQSLLNIKRKKDEQFTLVLTWKDAHKAEGLTQIIALEQAGKFCELIIKNMKSFGVKISKNIIKQPDLTLNDVTVKAYEQIDIMDLLENITILESRLPAEFTIDIVNTLMMLYQKAVEYYSALDDPGYDDFLEKLHLLLSREDVQILLKSKAETSTKSKRVEKNIGGQKKIIEPYEEEEEEEKKDNNNQNAQDYFQKNKMPMQPKKEENMLQKKQDNLVSSSKKQEIKQELKPEIKQEVKPEIKQEIKPEIKEDTKPEIKLDIREENQIKEEKQEIKEEENQEIKKEKQEIKEEENQKATEEKLEIKEEKQGIKEKKQEIKEENQDIQEEKQEIKEEEKQEIEEKEKQEIKEENQEIKAEKQEIKEEMHKTNEVLEANQEKIELESNQENKEETNLEEHKLEKNEENKENEGSQEVNSIEKSVENKEMEVSEMIETKEKETSEITETKEKEASEIIQEINLTLELAEKTANQ